MTANTARMSLRQIAIQLGVSHTLLVLWRQGKRRLPPELARRYHMLAESGYNESGYKGPGRPLSAPLPAQSQAPVYRSPTPKPVYRRAGSSVWSEHRTFNPSVLGSNPSRPTTVYRIAKASLGSGERPSYSVVARMVTDWSRNRRA